MVTNNNGTKNVSRKDVASTSHAKTSRVTVRFDIDTHQRAIYWADRHDISVNDYVTEAVLEKIARDNGVRIIPDSLVDHRISEIVDQTAGVSRELANLSEIVTSGFNSLIGLTRGDSYLSDDLG